MSPLVCFSVFTLLCLCVGVDAKPTIYMKNENDKLEPVLIPISSTVIPLPVYKVGYSVAVHGSKPPVKPEGENKLITASKKKTMPVDKAESTIKVFTNKEEKTNRDLL